MPIHVHNLSVVDEDNQTPILNILVTSRDDSGYVNGINLINVENPMSVISIRGFSAIRSVLNALNTIAYTDL